MADDDALGSVGPEEIFAPSGPRRSNFTPPVNDADAREAASNLFNDDAIAAAMAAELAKVASGPIPIIRPSEDPAPVPQAVQQPVEPEAQAEQPVAEQPGADEPAVSQAPADQPPTGTSFQLPPPAGEQPNTQFAPPAFDAPSFDPTSPPAAPRYEPPLFGSPAPAAPAPDFTPAPPAAPVSDFAPSSFAPPPAPAEAASPDAPAQAASEDPDRALYLSAPAPTVPPADAPPPPGYESTPRYIPSPPPADPPFNSLFDQPEPVESAVPEAPAAPETEPQSADGPPVFDVTAPEPPASSWFDATPPVPEVPAAPAPSPFESLFQPLSAPEPPPVAEAPAAPEPAPAPEPAAASDTISHESFFAPSASPEPAAAPEPAAIPEPTASPAGTATPESAAAASPEQPPQRRSLSDAELIDSLRSGTTSDEGAKNVIQQLQEQLELRAREAREYSRWEQSMLTLGTPDAAAALEQTRAQFAGVVGSAPEPVSEPSAPEPFSAAAFTAEAFTAEPFTAEPVVPEPFASSQPAPSFEAPAASAPPTVPDTSAPPTVPDTFAPPIPSQPSIPEPQASESEPPGFEPASFGTVFDLSEPSLEGTAFADAAPVEPSNAQEPSDFSTLAPPSNDPFSAFSAPAEPQTTSFAPPADDASVDLAPSWDLSSPAQPPVAQPAAASESPAPAEPAPFAIPEPAQPDSPVFLEPPALVEPPAEPVPFQSAPPPVYEAPAAYAPPPEATPVEAAPPAPFEPIAPEQALAEQFQAAPPVEPEPAPFAWQLPTATPDSVTAPPPEAAPVDLGSAQAPTASPVGDVPPPGVFDNLLAGSVEAPRDDAPSTWLAPEPSPSAVPDPPAPPPAEPPADPAEGTKRPFGGGVGRDNAVDPSPTVLDPGLGPVSVDTAGIATLAGATPVLLAPSTQPQLVRSRIFSPEVAGEEPTPADERVGRAARQFWLWFAANSSVVAIVFGAMLFSLGMSLRQAIVATLAGVAISFLPLGLGTLAGKRSGQPTMVVSRATFGIVGNILPAAVAVISRLFWGSALLWILGAGGASILVGAKLSGSLASSTLTIIMVVVGLVIAGVIAYFGYALIARVQLVVSIVSGVFVIGFIALTLRYVSIPTALTVGDGSWLLLITGAVLVFSFVGLMWANSSSDLARYQRVGSSGASSMLWATFGTALPSFVLIAYGALLAASNARIAGGIATDPLTTVGRLLPTWYPIPLLVATVLSLLSGIVVSMYSGGFALQAVGLRISRGYSTLLVSAVVLVIAVLFAVTNIGFAQLFRDFATTLAVPVAAWAGMFAAETMIRNRRFDSISLVRRGGVYADVRWPNLVAFVLITVVGLGFTTATTAGLGWEGYLFAATGVPLSGELASTDLGVFVALVVGLLFPIVAGIPAIRRQESTERAAE
jgi:purine-cytosine permease-like protein